MKTGWSVTFVMAISRTPSLLMGRVCHKHHNTQGSSRMDGANLSGHSLDASQPQFFIREVITTTGNQTEIATQQATPSHPGLRNRNPTIIREKDMTRSTTWLLNAALVALALPQAALAQSAPQQTQQAAGGLEEIVVTAQRRQESVQDVPIAVSAFSPAELERRNITEALDLIQYIPNLMGSNNTGLGSANAYYLRGIGNTESIATFDPPVGTYIDDIYVSRQNGNNFALFDVERIEVLRGPQGTLFGRNTTGGAVNVILAKPREEFGGFVEASYGRFDRVGVRGSVDVPFTDAFRVKVSGYWNDDNGYVKNVTTGERLNDVRNYGARLAATADITDNISWNTALMYTRDQSTNILNFDCNPAIPTQCDGRFVTTGLRKNAPAGSTQYINAAGAPLGITGPKANQPLGNDAETIIASSNFQVEWENATLNVITGLVDLQQKFNLDFFDGRGGPAVNFVAGADGVPRPTGIVAAPPVRGLRTGGFAITNDGSHKQFTQEFKISGNVFDGFVDYVAGAFYIKENNKTDFADVFTLTTPGTGTPLLLADRTLRNTTEATAGYVQVDVNVTDQLKLTAGIRYTDEQKEVEFLDNRPVCVAGGAPGVTCLNSTAFGSVDVDFNPATPGVAIPTKASTKLWTPRVAINFKPTDDVLLFASATRGFKSGGWNARGTTLQTLLPFGPEKVWSYEGGAKTEWFDRRLRFNITGFYMDVKDFQVPSAFLNPTTGALTFITRNFADLENKGLEIEFQAVPIEGLTLFVNAGIQDAKYKVNQNAPRTDAFNVLSVAAQQAECRAALANAASPRGDTRAATPRAQANCGVGIVGLDGSITDPVRSPDVTISGGVSYEMPLSGLGTITPAVNVSYIGKQEVGTSALTIFQQGGTLNTTSGDFVTGSRSDSVVRVNASVSFETEDDLWRISAECDNCFGEVQVQSTLSNYTYLSPPSTWRVTLRRKF
jgi:iron complex outermembrane receptor protein